MQHCPPEILRQVLSHVEPDDVDRERTLRAMSLSCRSIAPLAQEQIFRVVNLVEHDNDQDNKLGQFWSLIGSNPALGAYVRGLSIELLHHRAIKDVLTRMDELGVAPHIAQTTHLILNNWLLVDEDDITQFRRVFENLWSVQSLKLNRCDFYSVDRMDAALSSFRTSLRTFETSQVGVRRIEEGDSVSEPVSLRNSAQQQWVLETFLMSEVHTPRLATWFLRHCQAIYLTRLRLTVSSRSDAEAASIIFSQCKALQHLELGMEMSNWHELTAATDKFDFAELHDLRSLTIGRLFRRNWELLPTMLATLPEPNSLERIEVSECWITDCSIWETVWVEVFNHFDSQLSSAKFARLKELNVDMYYHNRGDNVGDLPDVMPLASKRGVLFYNSYDF